MPEPRQARAAGPPGSPLQEAVLRVGDRWTLLIVDALLAGPRRFNDLASDLPGIASNILSQRLKDLERWGLVVVQPYSERPPRFAYQLSAAGRELAGALRLLAECGTQLETRWYCPTCARLVEDGEAGELRFA